MESVRENNKQKFADNSKIRLKNNIAGKLRTVMIGAIARFEENFGQFWGHGQDQVTPEQEVLREVWTETRKQILDAGNHQIRKLTEDMSEFNVEWNKNDIQLPILGDAVRE